MTLHFYYIEYNIARAGSGLFEKTLLLGCEHHSKKTTTRESLKVVLTRV